MIQGDGEFLDGQFRFEDSLDNGATIRVELGKNLDQLTIDFSDAESVLFAACILDQHGEWERAIELFRHALRQWPDEQGTYAKNSIEAIQEKIALGESEH